jgi:hypothetical protein
MGLLGRELHERRREVIDGRRFMRTRASSCRGATLALEAALEANATGWPALAMRRSPLMR